MLRWNGSELESIFHRDGLAPLLLIQPSTPSTPAGGSTAAPAPAIQESDSQRLYLSDEAVHLSSKGEARIEVSCFGPDARSGEISVRSAKRLKRGAKAQRVTLGSGKFKVPSGRRSTVRVRISRYGRAPIALKGKLRVSARAEFPSGANRRVAKRRSRSCPGADRSSFSP